MKTITVSTFDDLLLKAVQLFDRSPDTLERYANRYRYLLVDEFQDTNVVQYRLARQLASQHNNICVVGDPDQSIYSWRHADIRNILSFEKDFPKAKTIFLEQNYRSTQTILDSAHHVIAGNRQRKEKSLWTDKGLGVPITMSEAYNEQDEAQTVAREVERLQRDDNYAPGDIAVMYRTNAQSRVLEESFMRYGIPYRLVGGTRFYERREVKDVVAYLRLVHNPYDTVSLRRIINVPKRSIGQKTVDGLFMWATQLGMPPYTALQLLANPPEEGIQGPEPPFGSGPRRALTSFLHMLNGLLEDGKGREVPQLISLVAERSGYREALLESEDRGEDRWENVMELRSVASEYLGMEPDEALTALLDGVALVSDTDDIDARANAVTLITLHQAKGLEYPAVFLVGMEEGLLPHRRSIDDPRPDGRGASAVLCGNDPGQGAPLSRAGPSEAQHDGIQQRQPALPLPRGHTPGPDRQLLPEPQGLPGPRRRPVVVIAQTEGQATSPFLRRRPRATRGLRRRNSGFMHGVGGGPSWSP